MQRATRRYQTSLAFSLTFAAVMTMMPVAGQAQWLEDHIITNSNRSAHGLSSWSQKSNNNRALQIQQDGGLHPPNGKLKIEYYGHMAFKLTSPQGITVVVDPWRNDPSGVWGVWYKQNFPFVTADVGLSTHAHFDHDGLTGLDSIMLLDRMGGKWEFGDVKILGIVDKHICKIMGKLGWVKIVEQVEGYDVCPPNNPTQWDNVMYVIDLGGFKVFHSGDNRPDKPDHVYEMIGTDIDVMIQAVDDSGHIFDHVSVDALAERMGANVIIPGHYRIDKVTNPESTLEPADMYVFNGHPNNHTLVEQGEIELTKADLEGKEGHVMFFRNNTKLPIWTPPEGSDVYGDKEAGFYTTKRQ